MSSWALRYIDVEQMMDSPHALDRRLDLVTACRWTAFSIQFQFLMASEQIKVLHTNGNIHPSVGRLIAAQNPDGEKTSLWRKLQAWGDSYLGSVIELNGMKVRLLSFKPLRTIKKQTKGDPSFWCSILRVIGFLSCLRAVGASPASAPGSLPSSQLSSTYPTFFYVGVAATIIGTAIAVLSLGVNLYYHWRGRGDGLRGILNVLTRPFRERHRGLFMFVRRLRVGEASLDELQLELPV